MKIALRILFPLIILAAGYWLMQKLGESEEEEVGKQRRGSLPKVRAVELRKTKFDVKISSEGVVRAHNSTSLTPRVAGRIHTIRKEFEDGAFFKLDDVLVVLDPTDFEASLAAARARVARAEAALAQEQARAEQALLDWKDLGYDEDPSPLVLRVPQLKEAQANLDAATAEQTQADRDLARCEVTAPYAGCVLRRTVGLGQSVGSNTPLGEVFATDFAEVRLPLSATDLSFFDFPEEDTAEPVTATLYDALDAESTQSWTGTVVRTEGVLDETSRELFVITRVVDPYGLETKQPPLRVGQPVRARIDGRTLKDVFVLPREGLRKPTEIVLINPEDFTIQRTEIDPVWADAENVVVRDDLPEGWLLVISQLPYAANGTKVEVLEDPPEGEPKAAHAAEDPPEES